MLLNDNMSALWNAVFCSRVKDDSKTLTMDEGSSSEYSHVYQNIRRHNEEDSNKYGLALSLSEHKIRVASRK